jgi:PAS domain S-box-containing protein
MNPSAYAFIGLTAIVAALIGILVFAVLRFSAAASDAKQHLRENRSETAFVTAALQDAVTKLKAQEREMTARAEASERLSLEIVESLTSGLMVVASDGQIRILNPAGRTLLGVSGGAVSQHYRQVLRLFAPLADVIEDCIKSRRPAVRRKLEMESGEGRPAYLGVTVSPLTNEEEQPSGVICLFTDLTPYIEMEEQLRLKDSLAEVGELTAGIAHEFRNGLATIHGYARLMDRNALSESFRPHLDGIRQETAALGEVVTNFLNFAKPTHVTLSHVDMRAVIERAADELRNDARARGGAVMVRGEFAIVQGDDVLLRQAFSNLVRNAIEACGDSGPEVVIDGRVEGANLRVSVDDNGTGIPPGARERVFRPFFTTKGRGTGLGLALVQKIVVTHNGRIHVGTARSGGASFQIVLPIASRFERQAAQASVTER